MEPGGGVEPPFRPYEGRVLPLNEPGMVRMAGLEPTTSRSQTGRSSILSYTREIGAASGNRTRILDLEDRCSTFELQPQGGFSLSRVFVSVGVARGERLERPYPEPKSGVLPLDDPRTRRSVGQWRAR